MNAPRAILRKHPVPRALMGHPWVFAGEITRWEGEPAVHTHVEVYDHRGRFLGNALYSPRSNIRLRIYTRSRQPWDDAYLENQLLTAIARRGALPADAAARLVWSEADALPGLVVDRYGSQAVCMQIQHTAINAVRESILTLIQTHLFPQVLVERSDSPGRKMEGLPPRTEMVCGVTSRVTCRIGTALFEVDLLQGQKSGSYLDQANNYKLLAAHCAGKNVLDCFCHSGGFAIHAALAGAKYVEAVDISEEASRSTQSAATLNSVAITTRIANVFDDLRARDKAGEHWDVIILDPPSFTRTREALPGALRGYHEINLRAMKLLKPGGLLATFTCSHHIGPEDYLTMLRSAASDARRSFTILEQYTQAPDHPVLLAMPESGYLRGWLLQAADHHRIK